MDRLYGFPEFSWMAPCFLLLRRCWPCPQTSVASMKTQSSATPRSWITSRKALALMRCSPRAMKWWKTRLVNSVRSVLNLWALPTKCCALFSWNTLRAFFAVVIYKSIKINIPILWSGNFEARPGDFAHKAHSIPDQKIKIAEPPRDEDVIQNW